MSRDLPVILAELSRWLHALPLYLPGHPRPTRRQLRRQARLLARAQAAIGYRTLPAVKAAPACGLGDEP